MSNIQISEDIIMKISEKNNIDHKDTDSISTLVEKYLSNYIDNNKDIKFNKYVYAYLNPSIKLDIPLIIRYDDQDIIFEYEPFYIGNGSAERKYEHLKLYEKDRNIDKKNTIQSIFDKGLKPLIIDLKDSLSSKQAYSYELDIIKKLSKRFNLTNNIDRNILDKKIPTNIEISDDNLESMELNKILDVLNRTPNIRTASKLLGMSERTLYRRRVSYGIELIDDEWCQK